MPLYEYECSKCGARFELLRRMHDDDRDLRCPKCDAKKVERLVSGFAAGNCAGASRGFT